MFSTGRDAYDGRARPIGPCREGCPVYIAEGEFAGSTGQPKKFAGYRWFESISLQQRVCELSVPLALDLNLQGLKVSRGVTKWTSSEP